jgi:lipopolysaccharide cholinephosphotransferase
MLTEYELMRLQSSLNYVLERLSSILERESIKYYLDFGTLLGAYRHSGFIPWDDDLDISISISDIPQVKHLVETEMADIVRVKFPSEAAPCTVSLQLELIGISGREMYFEERGVEIEYLPNFSLDIFGLESGSKFALTPLSRAYRLIVSRLWLSRQFSPFISRDYAKTKVRFGEFVFFFLSKIPYRWVDELARQPKRNFHDQGKYTHSIRSAFANVSINLSLGNAKSTLVFNSRNYPVPNNVEDYLSSLYGRDFRELPEESQRKQHFRTLEICQNSPFRSFFD